MFYDKTHWRDYLTFRKVNSVIKFLTISDVIIIGGFGLVTPVFAVFIVDGIEGGTLAVVGIAEAIFLFTKSIIQIPAASLIDKIKGEKDDFWVLFIGSIIYSIIPLWYLLINTPIELYIVQFFYGLSTAATIPSWLAIFTRHIDKKHEGIEWGVRQTLVDLGAALTASCGGFLAFYFGFTLLFFLVSISSFIGSFFLLGVYRHMKTGRVFPW
ncbi:MAG: MFS transporter [Patescibacteria group bacterium]